MNPVEPTDDAKVALMLCGRFGGKAAPGAENPLGLREYNRLAQWLHGRGLRLLDLLGEEGRRMLAGAPADVDPPRIARLLGRGPAMAFAVEKWTRTGLWIVCRADVHYPRRIRDHLGRQAPPILYGIGEVGLLARGGLAFVGSRNVDDAGRAFTVEAARACAGQGIQVVSGGARGVDEIAMRTALEAGGTVAGALADSLLRAAVSPKYRDAIRQGRLALVSAFSPEAGFSVGNAMGRNKQIYAFCDWALVISAENGRGGTWAGVVEELRRDHPRPVFVRAGEGVPGGNRDLLEKGARPFPAPPWDGELASRLTDRPAARPRSAGVQRPLFGDAPAATLAAAVEETTRSFQPCLPPAGDDEGRQSPAGVFEAVLPVLLDALGEWRTAKDLAETLGVRKVQMDDWLQRAMVEGRVEKKTRPVMFRRPRSSN